MASSFLGASAAWLALVVAEDSGWELGFGIGGGALFGFLSALVLAYWMVLRPARELAAQATRLAAGDLTARSGFPRADARAPNEIVRLGQALDGMAERLAADIRRLQLNEERYREVVERAVDSIFTSDANGVLLDVNPSGCALMRRSRAQILGRPTADFVHPDESVDLAAAIELLHQGKTVVRQWRLRLADGSYVPIEVSATQLPDGRLQGITRDITHRKRDEDELRRLVAHQRTVAELGQRALAETDPNRLLDDVVTLVVEGLGATHGSIVELSADASSLIFRAGMGWSPSAVAQLRVSPTGPHSQSGYALLADRPVVVEDFRVERRFSVPSVVHDEGVVSGLSVIIRGGALPFGVLSIQATERRHFTPDDVHFVEAVANLLAQSIVRARTDQALRLSETRYRLAARATRDAIYDLDFTVNETVWKEGVTFLFGHPAGLEKKGFDWWSDRLHPEDRDRVLHSVERTLAQRGRSWRAEYRFQRADGSYAPVQDRAYVEYRADGGPLRAVGAITDLTEQQRAEHAFRRQVGFVQLSRAVAVTANQASDVSEAIGAALQSICAHTGWPVGHALLLSRVERSLPPPSLWHCDDPARYASFRAASDVAGFHYGVGMVGRVWAAGEPVWMAPLEHQTDQAFLRRASAAAVGLRAAFAFPILVGTAVVGILEFFSDRTDGPEPDLLAVMGGIGAQLGRVIERAQAEGELRQYAVRLATLSRRLLEAQELERRHVARELHDEVGQALTALKLNLQLLGNHVDAKSARATLDESITIAERTLGQIRDLSLDLRPPLLDDLGLIPALRWYLDRQGRRAGFATEFNAANVGDAVPAEIATTCFRIAQEALTNVARHASAASVTMALSRNGTALELVVRDSGRGFDPEAASVLAAKGCSLGLLNMGERAALVGGKLSIDSAVGRGTEVRVQLPIVPTTERST